MSKLKEIEEELLPLHTALPKDEHGGLESSVVRYALHRYFVQKHGWFMRGLDPRVSVVSNSSDAEILKDRVPAYIQSVIDKDLNGGWGLYELAIYAAALSELIRVEASQDLEVVYEMLKLPTDRALSNKEAESVTTAYILHYILEENHAFATLGEMLTEVIETYPGWEDFNMWAQDVRQSLAYTERARHSPFTEGVSFQQMMHTVQEIGHRYGSFQKEECSSLTNVLLDLELNSTGRASLAAFWSVGLEGTWRFWESEEYLRFAGALDDHKPGQPTLIIPNFLSGQSNCVASSSFFEVCCVNECESLMARVESNVTSPEASVDHVVELISGLESETVDAPRTLPDSLVSKLHQIAQSHAGKVPLHGRLFGQWMHHAFPRECPYPVLGHVRQAMTPEQWTEATGVEAVLSDGEMAQLMHKHKTVGQEEIELPWAMVEDYTVVKRETGPSFSSIMRVVMASLASGSFMIVLVQAIKASREPAGDKIHRV